MKNVLKISILILILISGIIWGVNRMLYSANFLILSKVPLENYLPFFKNKELEYKNVFSFYNLRNSLSIIQIERKYSCLFWKYNVYSVVPEFENNCLLDSFIVENPLVDIYYHNAPKLIHYNKQMNFEETETSVQFSCNSSVLDVKKGENFLNIFAKIDEVGIFNEQKCDTKFAFEPISYARIVFYKGKEDFYIILLHGIDNTILQKEDDFLIDFSTLEI